MAEENLENKTEKKITRRRTTQKEILQKSNKSIKGK